MSDVVNAIALAAAFGAITQAAQHYFPWGLIYRRELPKVPAYIMGTLGWVLPLTVLFWAWDSSLVAVPRWMYLVAVWACVSASGLAVVAVRGLDWVLDRVVRSFECEERNEAQA